MSGTSSASIGINANCRWCGMLHGALCPAVKAIEYHQNGAIKRVEFKVALDFPQINSGPIQPWLVGGIPAGPSAIS